MLSLVDSKCYHFVKVDSQMFSIDSRFSQYLTNVIFDRQQVSSLSHKCYLQQIADFLATCISQLLSSVDSKYSHSLTILSSVDGKFSQYLTNAVFSSRRHIFSLIIPSFVDSIFCFGPKLWTVSKNIHLANMISTMPCSCFHLILREKVITKYIYFLL